MLRGLEDSVVTVFRAGMALLNCVLQEFAPLVVGAKKAADAKSLKIRTAGPLSPPLTAGLQKHG